MLLDKTDLPETMELTPVSGTVNVLYDTSDPEVEQSDGVITSVTPSSPDSGIQTSFSGLTVTVSGTGYEQAFASEIGYAEPQINPLAKPNYVEVQSWGPVPDPTDTTNFWFLYKYKAPDATVRTITYTVSGTYSETPMITTGEGELATTTPGETVTGIPFNLTFTQTVNYDLDSNVAEFRRYI